MLPLIGITPQIDKNHNPYIDKRYLALISNAGGLPVVLPLPQNASEAEEIMEHIDGLLIPGGNDIEPSLYNQERHPTTEEAVPERDKGELLLLEAVKHANKPFLGICRGCQILQVSFGGGLLQDIPSMREGSLKHSQPEPYHITAHENTALPDTPLAKVLEAAGHPLTFAVNTLHHQAISEEVAPGLTVMARSEDGIIEGVWAPQYKFMWGVQWHPEMMPDAALSCIIAKAFIAATRSAS